MKDYSGRLYPFCGERKAITHKRIQLYHLHMVASDRIRMLIECAAGVMLTLMRVMNPTLLIGSLLGANERDISKVWKENCRLEHLRIQSCGLRSDDARTLMIFQVSEP